MKIIAVCLDRIAQDFTTKIEMLHRCGWERAVLVSNGLVLGEINFLREPVKAGDFRYCADQPPESERVTYNEMTGLTAVRAKPGERKMTSEEVYELLESFP